MKYLAQIATLLTAQKQLQLPLLFLHSSLSEAKATLDTTFKNKQHETKVTRPTFSSTRQLQTLNSTQRFQSRYELRSAIDEYCENPNGWVNSTKYAMYG